MRLISNFIKTLVDGLVFGVGIVLGVYVIDQLFFGGNLVELLTILSRAAREL